jgi:hypothetical protein
MDPINPYQPFDQAPGNPMAPVGGLRRSILTQVRVIATLLIVHGVGLTLMGLLYITMAFIMPSVITAQNRQMLRPGGPSPEQMTMILYATYGVMGAGGILPGVLQIFAGISNLRFKGRVLGITALVGGLVGVATCYCLPTAIGLCIYGLIIYLNESAVRAFALVADGNTVEQMEQMAN